MALRLPGWWQDLTSPEFRTLDPERTVAVLPVGAIEQHGPHLAVAVDACLNEAVHRRALEIAPAGLPVLLLPMQSVGKSDEHIDFPGTLTLSAGTLTRICVETGASVRRAGIRKLLLLNSHGGQPQVLQIAARHLRVEHTMFVVSANWFSWSLPDGLIGAREAAHGIHAGTVETAMMLATRPDLVHPGLADDFQPTTLEDEEEFPRLRALGAAGFGWKAQDLHRRGAMGDATAATSDMGRTIIEHAAARLVELWEEMVRYPLARLRDG